MGYSPWGWQRVEHDFWTKQPQHRNIWYQLSWRWREKPQAWQELRAGGRVRDGAVWKPRDGRRPQPWVKSPRRLSSTPGWVWAKSHSPERRLTPDGSKWTLERVSRPRCLAWCSVMTWRAGLGGCEKRAGREGVSVHIWLTHDAGQQKATQR